jgi:hypothetical protein
VLSLYDTGMNTQQRGAEVIRRAENDLRGLIAEATEAAEYEDLLVLAEWARQLRLLIPQAGTAPPVDGRDGPGASGAPADDRVSTVQPAPDAGPPSPVLVPVKRVMPSSQPSPVKRSTKARARKGTAKAGARKKSLTGYPKFIRDGENLVKIGWSKKEKTQYEHKSPKSVLGPLLESLLAAGGDGHRFTTDDVLPLREAGDGTEIPSYQSYLCLAWLRSEELIEQHGRQGYSLPQPDRLAASVEESWERLARR